MSVFVLTLDAYSGTLIVYGLLGMLYHCVVSFCTNTCLCTCPLHFAGLLQVALLCLVSTSSVASASSSTEQKQVPQDAQVEATECLKKMLPGVDPIMLRTVATFSHSAAAQRVEDGNKPSHGRPSI